MNRRELMKLLGLGVVAPGAAYEALKPKGIYPDFDPAKHVAVDPSDVAWVEPTGFDKCTIHYPDGTCVTHELGSGITITNVTACKTT